MKKLLVSASFAIFACLGMNAQTVITNNYESPISSLNETKSNDNANSFVKGTDLNVSYSSEAKLLGLSFASDLNDFLYMSLNFAADIDGFDTYQSILGLGLSKRYQIGDNLLIQGKIGPYAGYMKRKSFYMALTVQFLPVLNYGIPRKGIQLSSLSDII